MAEEPGQMSVKERIAQLKLNQVGRLPELSPPAYEQVTNGTTWAKKRPPPPPPPTRPDVPARPSAHSRAQTANVPTTQDHVSNGYGIGNQPERDSPVANANGMNGISRPALPPRTGSQASQGQGPTLPPRTPSGPSPGLPPRRTSETPSQSDYRLGRRGSNESVSSIATARSSVSGMSMATSVTSQSDRSVKAPAYDPSSLPQLPPKRTTEEKQAYYNTGTKPGSSAGRRPLKSTYSSPNIAEKQVATTPPPSRRPSAQPPPALPSRTQSIQEQPLRIEPATRPVPAEPPRPKRSPLEMGMNSGMRPNLPSARPGSVPQTNGPAPPIPTASRPDLAALQSSKPKPNGGGVVAVATAPTGSCLHCRDFSGPDNHAARFPRESLPRHDIGWLANQLTAPFQSETDMARAIFTWLHHNVAYDTVAFFNHNVRPSTPQKTLETGLAVCEGYAGLFAALAMKAGLEAYVVSGHGKGYGYSKRRPGDPIPTYEAGHAWNAVKIDGGQWKLIDACWGAGTVNGASQPYSKRFAPERFTQSNEDFGMDHFPGDKNRQFRGDGRAVDWESYILGAKNGCAADFYAGYISEEGLSAKTFTPVSNPITLSQQGPTVRFSFQKICPHWDPVQCGKGLYYLYVLHLDGLDGTDQNNVPFESNGDVWWCDIPLQDLGRAGQKAQIYTVTSFDGRDGRGLTIQEYRHGKGRCGMGFGGVCKWEVA
ncbi:hypothetical protein LTR36_008391 [Oleoguttula mirabilis]|uniref:Transglutaminase-like domain-containing protein n=1 Tax=Oleoguttula mirabilis TaxID=1507867 RepID=A0AAV9J8E0_9PEZI|nr:hypothetical protein LTR36_008391 [Oleoguttula mirabilis]